MRTAPLRKFLEVVRVDAVQPDEVLVDLCRDYQAKFDEAVDDRRHEQDDADEGNRDIPELSGRPALLRTLCNALVTELRVAPALHNSAHG